MYRTCLAALVALAILFMLPGCANNSAHQILVFTKTDGFRHDSIEPGVVAVRRLGSEHGFSIHHTEDASAFEESNLAQYNVIMFLNTTKDILNEEQQLAMTRFIQAGGGFVGVHAATDTEYDWPWYNGLVGAYFRSHPGDPNVREGVIHVVDSTHGSTQHLPQMWTVNDEFYEFKSMTSGLNVLLDIDEATYKTDEDTPIEGIRPHAWYHEYDGGRSFYTALGHTSEMYRNDNFLQHLLGGIQYALGDGSRPNFASGSLIPDENRFNQIVFAEGLDEPTELEILPDGRLIFAERKGDLHIMDPESRDLSTVTTLEVNTTHEDGLMGIALDPEYAENNWVYLYYSNPGDEPKNILSRFVLADDHLDRASEKVLLEVTGPKAGVLPYGRLHRI